MEKGVTAKAGSSDEVIPAPAPRLWGEELGEAGGCRLGPHWRQNVEQQVEPAQCGQGESPVVMATAVSVDRGRALG